MATPFPRTGISAVPPLRRAAQYVRMSTEHQQYSTENQRDAIAKYAAHRGLKVVATYADDGKSGLRLDGRDALKRLIDDVENGADDFDLILVYDVSAYSDEKGHRFRRIAGSDSDRSRAAIPTDGGQLRWVKIRFMPPHTDGCTVVAGDGRLQA